MFKKNTVSFVRLFAVAAGLGAIAGGAMGSGMASEPRASAITCCDTCVCCECPDGCDCTTCGLCDCGDGCECDLCECC